MDYPRRQFNTLVIQKANEIIKQRQHEKDLIEQKKKDFYAKYRSIIYLALIKYKEFIEKSELEQMKDLINNFYGPDKNGGYVIKNTYEKV